MLLLGPISNVGLTLLVHEIVHAKVGVERDKGLPAWLVLGGFQLVKVVEHVGLLLGLGDLRLFHSRSAGSSEALLEFGKHGGGR